MDVLVVALRLIHVFCGVFWAGTIFFMVSFLQPAVRAAGPAGGQFMQRLAATRFLTIVPVLAVLTILSGIVLLWRVSGGSAEWMGSPVGVTLSAGGTAAIVAFLIGFFVMRRATLRVLAIGQVVQAAGSPPSPEQQADIQALQRRARVSALWVAALLLVAVVTMAVARYA